MPDPDSDLWDRLKGHLLPEFTEIVPEEEYLIEESFKEISVEVVDMVVHDTGLKDIVYTATVFLGKASRSCKQCGEVKFYKEFNSSINPDKLCRLCEDWAEQEALMEALTETERAEIAALEEDIIDAEDIYEDAWERQHMIDQVLRELDG